MQLNEQSKIIYKNHNYNYTFLQRQIDYVKNKIVSANMDGQTPVVLALQRTPMLISCMFALLDLHIPGFCRLILISRQKESVRC